MQELLLYLQIFVAASIFFVWVVRYENIVEEFARYGLPTWLRDLIGIMKLSFALMLVVGIFKPQAAVVGGAGLVFLMACAFAIHLRCKTPTPKRLPSLALLSISAFITLLNTDALG